jgi:hypothetical protein
MAYSQISIEVLAAWRSEKSAGRVSPRDWLSPLIFFSVLVQVLGLAAGTGGAGALAYGLTVVLPTTIEDLLALTVCSLLG